MENVDLFGIYIGEFIVVVLSQIFINLEYNMLRICVVKVIRYFGVVGECNIQYVFNLEFKEVCIFFYMKYVCVINIIFFYFSFVYWIFFIILF